MAELLLLAVMGLVLRFSMEFTDSNLFRYVLVGLICFVGFTFLCTLAFILSKTFVKTRKCVGRIYSVEESEELGLRVGRLSTGTNFGGRRELRKGGRGSGGRVKRCVADRFKSPRCHFVEINPSTPAN